MLVNPDSWNITEKMMTSGSNYKQDSDTGGSSRAQKVITTCPRITVVTGDS